jgi:hypothetical protein
VGHDMGPSHTGRSAGDINDLINFIFPASCNIPDVWMAPQGKQAVIPKNIADKVGMDRRPLGDAIEDFKGGSGMRGDYNVGVYYGSGRTVRQIDGDQIRNRRYSSKQ